MSNTYAVGHEGRLEHLWAFDFVVGNQHIPQSRDYFLYDQRHEKIHMDSHSVLSW